MTAALLEIDQLVIAYRRAGIEPILAGLDLEVLPSQVVHLDGPSGVGKSSVLRVAAGLQRPTDGRVRLAGVDVLGASSGAQAALRRNVVSHLAQDPVLVPEFDLVTNIALPAVIAGVGRRRARTEAVALLGELGLTARRRHRAVEVSGGELRRAGIARALVARSPLLLLDEPFADLDADNIERVASLIAARVVDGAGVLVASHVPLPAALAPDRAIVLGATAVRASPCR